MIVIAFSADRLAEMNNRKTADAILSHVEMDEKETQRAVRMTSKLDQNEACKDALTWLEWNNN